MLKENKTYRTAVNLPGIPAEDDSIFHNIPIFEMIKCYFDATGKLKCENGNDVYDVINHGFFLLKAPEDIDLRSGDKLVRNFYKPAEVGEFADYTGFKEKSLNTPYEGYFDREFDQWENFYIERKNWALLPSDVSTQAGDMATLGIKVLREILSLIHIEEKDWERITNGLTENRGHQMLALNHFRTDKNTRGCKFHRDSGWVTILRSSESGLLAYIKGSLWAVNPEDGYFIINFGSSIEVLTECTPKKVHANVHGVVKTCRLAEQERFSYAVFLDSDLQGDVYKYFPGTGPKKVQSMKEFAEQEVKRTYDDYSSTL